MSFLKNLTKIVETKKTKVRPKYNFCFHVESLLMKEQSNFLEVTSLQKKSDKWDEIAILFPTVCKSLKSA